MIAAPLSVVLTLLVARNVWLTFGCYHLLICLVLPWLDTVLVRRGSVVDHLRQVGLVGGRGNETGAGVRTGISLGLLLGCGTILIFAVWGDVFLADNRIREVLTGWSVTPPQYPLMTAFMTLGNGAAEELFWRGYIHRRLEAVPRRRLTIGITALAYTTYHLVTLGAFLTQMWLIVLCTAAVFAAGLLWGWLRERYGNVWPALLGHVGATAAYMLIFWRKIAMS